MHQTLILLTLAFSVARPALAMPEMSRLRELYKKGCRTELQPPPGSRTATGVMVAEDATGEEFELGLKLLRRSAKRAAIGNYPFASFLYHLTAERSDAQIEDVFFEYLNRPGNEALRRDYAGEIMEVTAQDALLRDTHDETTAARIAQVIELLREDPAQNAPLWDNVITAFVMGKFVDGDGIMNALEAFRELPMYEGDAVELVTEFMRPIGRKVADLRVGGTHDLEISDVRFLIIGLRLDEWIRAESRLPDAPGVVGIVRRIGLLSQALTRH